jgi:ribulose-phosphate 3-epimerase
MKKLSASILSADFSNLKEEIIIAEKAGIDMIHCDIMDGHFVPNISYGPYIVETINKITTLPLDVHLMIDNCDFFLDKFIRVGADYISIHFENNVHLNRVINRIKQNNIKAGIAINPSTPVGYLDDLLELCDFILVMSVNPGFGGQKFIDSSLHKIDVLKSKVIKYSLNTFIEVDGGINLDNIKSVKDAGADVVVAGASIYHNSNKTDVIKKMKSILNQ